MLVHTSVYTTSAPVTAATGSFPIVICAPLALASAQTDLGGREIHGVAAELRDPDVERQARPQARLFEDERHGAAAQATGGGPRLQARALVQQESELIALQVADGQEMAQTRCDRHYGRARRRGRRSSTRRSSAVATRAASWRIGSCFNQRAPGPLHLSITGAVTARTPRSSTLASSSLVGSRYVTPRSA